MRKPAPEPVVENKDDASTSNSDNVSAAQKEDPSKGDSGSSQSNENVTLDISTELPDRISFNDTDTAVDVGGNETEVSAPKTVERLEKLAHEANERRKAEEAEEEDEDDMPLKIGEEVRLELADINDLNRAVDVRPPPAINIETL